MSVLKVYNEVTVIIKKSHRLYEVILIRRIPGCFLRTLHGEIGSMWMLELSDVINTSEGQCSVASFCSYLQHWETNSSHWAPHTISLFPSFTHNPRASRQPQAYVNARPLTRGCQLGSEALYRAPDWKSTFLSFFPFVAFRSPGRFFFPFETSEAWGLRLVCDNEDTVVASLSTENSLEFRIK